MNKVLAIFCIALLVRIFFSLVMASHGDLSFLAPGDSAAYVGIAHNLIDHGAYASSPALIPDNHRPPLYPLFLVPFLALGASYFAIAVAQGVLMSCAIVLFYLIARKIFREDVVFAATLLLALEPGGLLYSALMMSEPLFMLFFIPAIFLLALSVYKKEMGSFVLASACLAFAALARAIALPLVIFVPLAALWSEGIHLPWKKLLLSGIVFIVVISPWLAFNVQTFSSLEFSSTGSRNLYEDNATGFERWLYPDKENYDFTIENRAAIVGEDRVLTVAGAHELGAVARAFIFEHPVKYAIFHALYMPRLFIHDGYNDVYRRLAGTEYQKTFSLYDRVATFDIAGIVEDVANNPGMLAGLIAKLFFLLITLFFFVHPLLAWKAGDRPLLRVSLFFVLFVLVYAFLVSPVGMARLRFVIHPILFILALDAIRLLVEWMKVRRTSALAKASSDFVDRGAVIDADA